MSSFISEYVIDNELNNILNELNIKGEIKDKKHPLVKYIKDKREKLKKSRIKNSYINSSIEL